MGIKELPNVESSGEVFAVFNATHPNGKRDPICRVAEGIAPDTEAADAHFFIALDGDPFRGRLGTLEVDTPEVGAAHLGLTAEMRLSEDPKLLSGVVQIAMEQAGVDSVTLHAERDTNVSEATLQLAGATAVSPMIYEFQIAA